VKSLLNITVFASAVLSIFSTSLTLYEAPGFKEALSIVEEENSSYIHVPEKELKRIYISHDVSSASETHTVPLVARKNSWKESKSTENAINVFGVLVPGNIAHRNT